MKIFKKILGWCILLNIVPFTLGIVAVWIPPCHSPIVAYGIGWIIQAFFAAIIGLLYVVKNLIIQE